VAIVDAVGIILTEDVDALNLTGGVEEGAVGPGAISNDPELYNSCIIMDYPDVISAVEEARDSIISGDIVIPDPMFAE
jgi:hypothetical protein